MWIYKIIGDIHNEELFTKKDVVGDSVFCTIFIFFSHLEQIRQFNGTSIVLIPKVDPLHFKPISLCNVIYKAITKIITNQIKKHMDKLISPN